MYSYIAIIIWLYLLQLLHSLWMCVGADLVGKWGTCQQTGTELRM